MKYRFRELIDIPSIQELTDELYKATSMPSAIVDMEGDILTGSGWQRICTEFHRKHPEIEKDCIESDTRIREQLDKGESYAIYKCPRGLVDASSPVIIDGEHVANVFIGQLFITPPDAETERFFREQAGKFGLDEKKYIESFHEVPIYPEAKFRSALSFLSKFAQLIATIGLSRMNEKKADEAWRTSQLFNETILNSSPDVIYLYDIVEKMNVYSNDSIMNILGVTAQDMTNMGDKLIEILMHPDDFKLYLKETLPLYQSVEDNVFIEHEYRMRSKDRGWRWLRSQESIFMRHEDGTPKQIFGIIRDITGQKKAEKALRDSEEKYRSFVENFHGIAFRGDLNFKPLFFHGSVEEITGYTEEEFVVGRQRWDQVVHPEDFKALLLEDAERLRSIPDYSNVREYRIIHKNGDIRWIQEIVHNICDDSGKPAIVQGTIYDITNRKNAEKSLEESEGKYRLLIQNSADLVILQDMEGKAEFISPNVIDVTGYSAEEFINKGQPEYIFPEDKKKCVDILGKVLAGGEIINFEYRLFDSNGKVNWMSHTARPLIENGNQTGILSNIRNVSQQKQLEEQLQIRQRMDSLGTLAGGIAHDFNNILVGILGNIDLLNLNTENFTEDQKEYLTDAGQSCNRAANLIRQFQTLTVGAARGKSVVDIHDILNEVFNFLKETTNCLIAKQIKFNKGEFYVTVNSGELHQVLLNLATNSAQAIEERGTKKGDYIRIKAEDYETGFGDKTGLAEGDYVHISFEDNGAGMSDDIMKKAFDPMFTTKEKGGKRGQGLGLAMVYNIVTRIYKGHIYIDSKAGKGTTFHIYLPKAQAISETDTKEVLDIKGGTETILVVDDESLVIKFTKKVLTNIGYTVLTASDGEEALKIYKKQKDSIDTVILDLTMPQMPGQLVFQKMLDINPEIKVIISSGFGDEYSKEGILAEAKGTVGKPYTMKDLAKTVRTVLDS